jgi:dihydroxyacetone kinase
MTFVHDEPTSFASQALRGFAAAYGRYVTLAPGGVLRAATAPTRKVAVVIGGGSGHYPDFAGYVGLGLADAAVAGDVFASPSTRAVARIARLAERGGGVLLGFGNYAGDVLNFGAAARRLIAEGIDARILPVTDDVASADAGTPELRRGVAGDIVVFKIAGAAAEAGKSLDEVERFARLANRRTVSFGVAFRGCTLPGAREPLFAVPDRQMAIGLGIHGEPGVAEEPIVSASALARVLVERLVREKPQDASGRVAIMLNGLGATKYEELFVLWTGVQAEIEARGLTIVAPEVGEFVTSLDMAGCSLTITWLDHGLEELWLAPADTAAFRRGAEIHAISQAPIAPAEEHIAVPASTEPSRVSALCLAGLMKEIAAAMHGAEEELVRIDARAGDGDHGQAMSRGSAAAAEATERAVAAGAGAASVLAIAADAWADRAGGASGALWGLGLRAWSEAFSDTAPIAASQIVRGARAALDAIAGLGGAKVGDKTLVDALDPFVTILEREMASGGNVAQAWRAAAESAAKAAAGTAPLTPRLGRARPLANRSVGHPDAGAISLAMVLRLAGERLAAPNGASS